MDGNELSEENGGIICPICCAVINDDVPSSKLTESGVQTILKACKVRNIPVVNAVPGGKVHNDCRRDFTNAKAISKSRRDKDADNQPSRKSFRSGSNPRKSKCLFCNIDITPTETTPYFNVHTDNFTKEILNCCSRRMDNWSNFVKSAIEYYVSDLHAYDVVYHQKCSVNFRTGKNIPTDLRGKVDPRLISPISNSGRPESSARNDAFLKTCEFLEENDEKAFTISELTGKMQEFAAVVGEDDEEESSSYSNKHMKRKLSEYYGNDIVFSVSSGRDTVVTLRRTADSIIRNFFTEAESADEGNRTRLIIEAAAKLIKSEIALKEYPDNKDYPSVESINLEETICYLPQSLQLFCRKIFSGVNTERKIASIGQAIVQASKPRKLLAPLQIGLGVQMHHLFRSRFLIDTLNAHGFCSSYTEIEKFERNASLVGSKEVNFAMESFTAGATEEERGSDSNYEPKVLFAADNVDHSLRTLNGEGTFHGMGIIAMINNPKRVKDFPILPRENVSNEQLLQTASVKIFDYKKEGRILPSLKLSKLSKLNFLPQTLDSLWHCSYFFRNPVPMWSGYMHLLHERKNTSDFKKSSVFFLPIIDLPASNMSCILSTLQYVSDLAQSHNQPTILTFDQPLFFKASLIIHESTSKQLKIICLLLGSFHTLMNLLGAIGTIMDGTGLRNVLENIYDDSTVNHMMTGKAVSRAIRGHFIVDYVLSALLIGKLSIATLLENLETLYCNVLSGKSEMELIEKSEDLASIVCELNNLKSSFYDSSNKTAELWLEYQKALGIVRMLITADRTGDWELHKTAISLSIPIFAAAGHHNYVKSSYLYLQNMLNLHTLNPEAYGVCSSGNFVSRRSNRFYAGLSPDLMIEQILMRSLKTRGGVTRGTGLSELQRSKWLLSMPVSSRYNLAMQTFTDVGFTTSDQHKEQGKTRILRDQKDIQAVFNFLSAISPFSETVCLRNIVTGLASETLETNKFYTLGINLVEKMEGQDVLSMKFPRKDRVKTLANKSTVQDKETGASIDPALLFQRLLVIATNSNDIDLAEILSYELCSFPPSLFEDHRMLLKSDKPPLAKAIERFVIQKKEDVSLSSEVFLEVEGGEDEGISKVLLESLDRPIDILEEIAEAEKQYILDGGSLLHRVIWRKGSTYDQICTSFAKFVYQEYGKAVVVFDGYENGPSTKDNTHRRRTLGKQCPLITFTPDMTASGKQESFLLNPKNKAKFIELATIHLKGIGCTVVQAEGDADLLVAKEAVKYGALIDTVVIAEDTDILILLLYHTSDEVQCNITFKSDKSNCKRVFDILECRKFLGEEVCKALPFLHAITGCDTTSSLFNIGKLTSFKKLIDMKSLRDIAHTFSVRGQSHADIEKLGENAVKLLYRCNNLEKPLNKIRHELLHSKVLKAKSYVKPEYLPPTSSSAKFHSHRTYLQVQDWICLTNDMNPEEWGWKRKENELLPITNDQNAAPESILKIFRCDCQTECLNMRCSCRKNGLPCTYACGLCQTTNCFNQEKDVPEEEFEENFDTL